MKMIFLLVILIFLTGCVNQSNNKISASMQSVNFQTSDGITIYGTYYPSDSNKGIILLHMLNHDRNSWSSVVSELSDYDVLVIDLRGHGQSLIRGRNWQSFGKNDFNDMILDAAAAKNFLEKNGAKEFMVMGASIGANTAINYAASDGDVKVVVLLSPSLDYRGIKTENSIRAYKGHALIISSKNDAQSYEDSKIMDRQISNSQLKIYEGNSHGTDMLKSNEIKNEVLKWIKEKL